MTRRLWKLKGKMKEAIHDRLLGPNQNGGKGYELPAIFNNPLSGDLIQDSRGNTEFSNR